MLANFFYFPWPKTTGSTRFQCWGWKGLNTRIIDATFQQSGKQDSSRHLLKSWASMSESSDSQFFRSTTGIQSGQEIQNSNSRFASAVSKCQSPFYSICFVNKNTKAVKFLEIKKKKVFLELKKKFFVKEKYISFIKNFFLQDTNYSCASMFITHAFISYIFSSLL